MIIKASYFYCFIITIICGVWNKNGIQFRRAGCQTMFDLLRRCTFAGITWGNVTFVWSKWFRPPIHLVPKHLFAIPESADVFHLYRHILELKEARSFIQWVIIIILDVFQKSILYNVTALPHPHLFTLNRRTGKQCKSCRYVYHYQKRDSDRHTSSELDIISKRTDTLCH